MMNFIKLTSISLQSKLYYRASLYISLFSPMVLLIGQYLMWNSIYLLQGEVSIANMSKNYMFSYILISFALNNLLTWSTESNLSREIISGNIVSRCIRPARFMTQTIADMVGGMIPYIISNTLIVAAGFLVFNNQLLMPSLTNWLSFIPCFILSTILRIALVEISSLLCFFTTSHLGISWTRRAIYEFFSGALIPVAMFPEFLKNISNATPFPYMLNIPISVLLGGDLPFSIPVILLIQILWIAVFFFLHCVLYGRISKNMMIAGG